MELNSHPLDCGYRMIHAHKVVPFYTVWRKTGNDVHEQIIIGGPKKITVVKVGNMEQGLMPTNRDLFEIHRLIIDALDDKGSGIIIVPDTIDIQQVEV